MTKNKKLITILSIVLITVLGLSSIVIPLVVNAGGGGGGGFDPGGSGWGKDGQRNGYVYVWFDDPTFKPQEIIDGTSSTPPIQGWYTRKNLTKDANGNYNDSTVIRKTSAYNGSHEYDQDPSFKYWVEQLLTPAIEESFNDGTTYSVNLGFNSDYWWILYNAMIDACENALARDQHSVHARVVGVALTWNDYAKPAKGEGNGSGWWNPAGYGALKPKTFAKLFGDTKPSAADLSTSSTNDWNNIVNKQYNKWSDALDNEKWFEYIYRIGQVDGDEIYKNATNPDAGLAVYVVAATDSMPVDTVKDGYLQITKTVPTGYTATGAQFQLFNNEADANANRNPISVTTYTSEANAKSNNGTNTTTITIGSDGKSPIVKVDLNKQTSRDIWIKETKGPNATGNFAWKINSTAYKRTITGDNTYEAAKILKYSLDNPVQEYGWAQIHKNVPTETTGKTSYNPKNAIYSIYTDAACTKPITSDLIASGINHFTIDENGDSNKIKFNVPTGGSRTFYIKETGLPDQPQIGFDWEWDNTIYTITVSKANTETSPARLYFNGARKDSFDPVTEYGYGYIIKTSDVVSQQDRVDGATFKIFKEDGVTPAIDYKTKKEIELIVENGKTDSFCVVVGNYVVKETYTPEGFSPMEDKKITITKNCNKEIDAELKIGLENHFEKAYVYITKQTDRGDKLDKYPLTGTTIGIYVDEDCKTLAVDVLTGKPCVLTVKSNMQTETVCLGLGKYYVQEISTTQWYELNTEIVPIDLEEDQSELDQPYNFNYDNMLKKGLGKVEKSFKDFMPPPPVY